MRKKVITGIIAAAFIFSLIALPLNYGGSSKADAANIKVLEMIDDFDSDSLNGEAWAVDGGAEHKDEYATLRLNSINTWGHHVSLQALPLSSEWENFSIEFDIAWASQNPSWSAIFFGMPAANYTFEGRDTKYMLSLNMSANTADGESGRGIRLAKKGDGTSFLTGVGQGSAYYESALTADANLAAGGKVQRVIMNFTKTALNEDKYELTFKWGPDSGNIKQSCVFSEISIDGYMGFTTYGMTTVMEIRNFSVTAEGTEAFSDDFRNPSVSYASAPSATASWRCAGNFSASKIYCGKVCTISFNDTANGKLVYSNPLTVLSTSDKNFEVSYDVKLEDIGEETYIGSGFGLESKSAAAASKNFIGFHKRGEGVYGFGIVRPGNKTAAGSELVFACSELNINIRFVGYYDKKIEVFAGSERLGVFTNVDFNGYLCVASYSEDPLAAGNQTSIDNFKLYVYETAISNSADAGINFKGGKEYESFGEMISEHYYNTKKWILYGNGVKMPVQMSRNYLQFVDVKGDAGFGPKQRYGDSIVRFDFCITALSDDVFAPFGLSFGRDYLDAYYYEAPGVFFTRQTTGSGATLTSITRIVGQNILTAGGSESIQSDINVYEDTSTWYTCMLIISNRAARVYLKKTADDDTAFGPAKITFVNVDSYGFIAVTINSTDGRKANFNITNFSVTNIDPVVYGG